VPAPPELIFAPTAPMPDAEPPAGEAPASSEEPPRFDASELPAWARELLEQSGVTDTVQQTAIFAGKTGAQSGAGQISWSAPGMANPVQSAKRTGPAELSFRERGETEESAARQTISDAELQRTADKVYKIIEERLRRELRRSGR
jgi:hypothetical protein